MPPKHQAGELLAGLVSRTPMYGSYRTRPDSASVFIMVVAVPAPHAAGGQLADRHQFVGDD